MSETAISPGQETTIKNLLAAYNGESNAHVRYGAFAAKADEEGCSKIAGLFRAASRSEQIHAENHAKVIQKLGGMPKATIGTPTVKATADNLRAAIAGEQYEIETMYPGFILEAEAHQLADAIRTFAGALASEKEHARLYSTVLEDLEKCSEKVCNKLATKTDYYVCPVCGYTAELLGDRCPVCNVPKEKFELVN